MKIPMELSVPLMRRTQRWVGNGYWQAQGAIMIASEVAECPISAERVADGRGFKFPADSVAMYLLSSGH